MILKRILELMLKEDISCLNCNSPNVVALSGEERHYLPLMLERVGLAYAGNKTTTKYVCLSCNQEFSL